MRNRSNHIASAGRNFQFLSGVTVWMLVIVFPLVCSSPIRAGVIDPGRSIDWTQAGVTGGIPNRTAICATLNPGVTAAQINSAIANCPAGQVVYLNAGSYNLSAGIDFNGQNNVTLRGAGPDKTILTFTAGSPCRGMGADICLGAENSSYYFENSPQTASWTAGFARGTTQITLSNTTGLSAGMIMILDQLDDSNIDTGNIWICQTNGVCVDEGPGGAGRPGRGQTQIVKATAINGIAVTITPGLYMPNWRSSQSPQAWWGDSNGFVKGIGVEDLTVDNTNNSSGTYSDLYLIWCYDCWVKNVKDLNSNRNHVWLFVSARSTVRDSYFYGTKNAASQSYGVESYTASDNLIENNIFQHITGPMMDGGATAGTVWSYNYAIDDYYYNPNWMMGSNWLHAVGSSMNLNEGNEGPAFAADNIHGTHHFVTTFRNYFTGYETGKWAQTVPIMLNAFSRYMNVVGNVLGTAGYHNNYEWNTSGGDCPSVGPSGSCSDTAIYRLGGSPNLPSLDDALVKSTLLRWGNYDTVTGAVQWAASEVPSSLIQYSNPMPPDHNLPASLYLAAKPSWWPTPIPWPAIGPDITGGNISGLGGHVYKIPAHVCYENAAKDANGILIFNANNCYSGSGTMPPSVPRNLRIR